MPIVDNISIHKNPKAFLDYILDKNKNNDMTYVTSLNLNAHDTESAVADLKRTFEMFDTKHSFTSRVSEEKSPVRVHHYIQSFNPKDNVTPELAHAIGVEWAKKCFGENAQVIVSTHVDKGHIHNHFAVGVYDLNGKHIISNSKTLY
ncbi:MAG: relaxase/mobilization nuclease domain-containing protein, partial [Treponema sp.]|nr:relaxase/mobilization nuclease domain-containing protein [Treponema sp.]